MKWTKEKPTKAGFYWWCEYKKSRSYIVTVFNNCDGDLDGLLLDDEDWDYNGLVEYFRNTRLKDIKGYWSSTVIERPSWA